SNLVGKATHSAADGVFFGDTINSIITSLGLPLILFSTFAVLLNGRGRYKKMLITNGCIAAATALVYFIVYYRYALGIVAVKTGDRFSAMGALDSMLAEMPDYNGFIAFNIYLDIFLCTLLMFFLDYKPKKFFQGKKIAVFRMFALLPILYELASILIKILAIERAVVIPMGLYPFLTSKPPLSFLFFMLLVIYVKNRERRFIKHGKTHEDYVAFLKTRTNSWHFSRTTVILMIVLAIVDVVQVFALTLIRLSSLGISFDSITGDQINEAMRWATVWGAGKMVFMVLLIPIILLFSYTKREKKGFVDTLIPISGVGLIILIYFECAYGILTHFVGSIDLSELAKTLG
ncbi:MAG: hypothetical protein VZQ83_09710, partial [Eubacterium sp.]|nr:hypothetical protein [Eubacterium sp.]